VVRKKRGKVVTLHRWMEQARKIAFRPSYWKVFISSCSHSFCIVFFIVLAARCRVTIKALAAPPAQRLPGLVGGSGE
jgi:hypothetical protein